MKKTYRLIIALIVVIIISSIIVYAHDNKQSSIIGWGESIGWDIDENNHTNGATMYYNFDSSVSSDYQAFTRSGSSKWGVLNIYNSSFGGTLNEYNDPNTSTVAAFYDYNHDSDGHLTSWKIKMNVHIMGSRSAAKNEITMAHEFGHAAGLNDLYLGSNSNKLMYGYSSRSASYPSSSDNKGANVITGAHSNHDFNGYDCNVCDGVEL